MRNLIIGGSILGKTTLGNWICEEREDNDLALTHFLKFRYNIQESFFLKRRKTPTGQRVKHLIDKIPSEADSCWNCWSHTSFGSFPSAASCKGKSRADRRVSSSSTGPQPGSSAIYHLCISLLHLQGEPKRRQFNKGSFTGRGEKQKMSFLK